MSDTIELILWFVIVTFSGAIGGLVACLLVIKMFTKTFREFLEDEGLEFEQQTLRLVESEDEDGIA